MNKYLFIYRNPADGNDFNPSPEEMQQVFAAWDTWKNKFKDQVIDVGDGLKPGGGVLKAGKMSDGPFIEAKEIVGGYSMVQTETFAQAVEIAKECPFNMTPGASIEIRELAGY
jgi:hypothetical protein